MNRRHTVLDSPLGPLTLVVEGDHLCGLYVEQGLAKALERRAVLGSRVAPEQDPVLQAVSEQLTAYFDGGLTEFDVPLASTGTPFQQRVWAALRAIPAGETVSYTELAQRIGSPAAVRAVAGACAANPVAVAIPCHRVVRTDGGLSGYRWGIERKAALIAREKDLTR